MIIPKPKVVPMPSPNFFTTGDMTCWNIHAVVLHGTSGPLKPAIDWLRNPQRDNPDNAVSANFVVSKAGVIYELVPFENGLRAFANGKVENYDTSIKWLNYAVKNKINPNWITVSVEHEATAQEMINRSPMTDLQFTSSINLVAYILDKCALVATHETIIGHNQISGVIKYNCPGVINTGAYTEQLLIRYPQLKQ